MSRGEELIQQTMRVIADAASHFDPSVAGNVTYSETPVTEVSTDQFWDENTSRSMWFATERGKHSRYGDNPKFSPEWLSTLTEDDHRRIAEFVESHPRSYWAIDGLLDAILRQCLNDLPDYAYLLRNFLLLWDNTTEHVLRYETEDCYTLHAISSLSAVDIGALSYVEQLQYEALAAFAVTGYICRLDGREGRPNAVEELLAPGVYQVHEPYRSMVLEHPNRVAFIVDYLSATNAAGADERLREMLSERTHSVLLAGLI